MALNQGLGRTQPLRFLVLHREDIQWRDHGTPLSPDLGWRELCRERGRFFFCCQFGRGPRCKTSSCPAICLVTSVVTTTPESAHFRRLQGGEIKSRFLKAANRAADDLCRFVSTMSTKGRLSLLEPNIGGHLCSPVCPLS